MSNLQAKVDFNRIRYAACWEDARVLREALHVKEGEKILIIASAGDNALATLVDTPSLVKAIDLSKPQLYLCELKMAAFARLDYDGMLLALGVQGPASDARRWQLYQHIRKELCAPARSFWDERRAIIESGVIHSGKFERYFRLFRKWLLPMVHKHESIRQLLKLKDGESQRLFFREKWNTIRWKALMALFFSKAVMGRYGRDPQFLAQVAVNVPRFIREKAEAHLQSPHATENPFLHYIFTGSYGRHLPVYLQEKYFPGIKSNISRLHFAAEDMDTAVKHDTYDCYCASNIFEYMPSDHFEYVVKDWSLAIPKGARIAYWNLMVPRSFAESAPELWQPTTYIPSWDAGFFYTRFLCEQKR